MTLRQRIEWLRRIWRYYRAYRVRSGYKRRDAWAQAREDWSKP